MSTFAVFGMTRDVALAEARKKVSTTRRSDSGQREQLTPQEWQQACEERADKIMASKRVKQLSPLYDAPQYAEQFIELARRTLDCRDLQIKAKSVLLDAQGEPLKDKKTGAPKVGLQAYQTKAA